MLHQKRLIQTDQAFFSFSIPDICLKFPEIESIVKLMESALTAGLCEV